MPGVEKYAESVLQSETFRHAPSSRRLLKFFLDRLAAGDAEPVKEYTIGVEAFSKPEGYDPRLDSTVRIQVGRLRQKLTEYYAGEGKDDPFVLDLPKGRLKLVCEERAPSPTAGEKGAPRSGNRPRAWAALALAGVLAVAGWSWWSAGRSAWGPELDEFWRPFMTGGKPVLITYGDPLFLQFENKVLVRDPSIERWEDLKKSERMTAAQEAVGGGGESRPVHYYAAVGDVSAAFLLGQRLGRVQPSMSLVRTSQLLWQQMADSNVVFLGPPRFFGDRLQNLPMALAIEESAEGFRLLEPAAGEAAVYRYRDPAGYFSEDGEAHVLVTRTAGPGGSTDLLMFASNSTFGRAGAVDALTSAAFGRTLGEKMRAAGWPRHFQLLLKVKYKGGVPTETGYVLHRALKRRG